MARDRFGRFRPRAAHRAAAPALAVRLAQTEDAGDRAEAEAFLALVKASVAAGEPVRISDLAVSGHDLIALGFLPGRLLQDILCDLLEVVWDDPQKNTRDALIKEALLRKD